MEVDDLYGAMDWLVRGQAREELPAGHGPDRGGVGKVLGAPKVAKHFCYEITADTFTFERDGEAIAREAALDGIYVIRTSVPAEALEAEEVVH